MSSGFGGSLSAGMVEGFDESFDELFEHVAASVACTPEKDAAFLRWRYGPGSPQFPVTVLAVKEGETLLGYAVLMVTSSGQAATCSTSLCSRIAATWRAAPGIDAFLSGGRSTNRTIQIPRFATTHRSSDLRRLGLFHRKGRRNSLLVKLADPTLHEMANDTANWPYTLGDGEGSF